MEAEIVKDGGEKLDIRVSPPANALVAKYELVVKTYRRGTRDKYKHGQPIFLLCNAWCEGECHVNLPP